MGSALATAAGASSAREVQGDAPARVARFEFEEATIAALQKAMTSGQLSARLRTEQPI